VARGGKRRHRNRCDEQCRDHSGTGAEETHTGRSVNDGEILVQPDSPLETKRLRLWFLA
jgi:hypothetical protein